MHYFGFVLCGIMDRFHLCAGRGGEGDIWQQWRDDPKATGSNARDGEGQWSVRKKKASNTQLKPKSQDFQDQIPKAWAHMHIPETLIQERRNWPQHDRREEKVSEVPWQLWDLPNKDLFPHHPLRDSGWAIRHIHKQHLLLNVILSVSMYYWYMMASVY